MKKITAGLFISLDGVVEAPDQWHFPYPAVATLARPVTAVTVASIDDEPCVFARAASGRLTAGRLHSPPG